MFLHLRQLDTLGAPSGPEPQRFQHHVDPDCPFIGRPQ
jgi:hypothetical protein